MTDAELIARLRSQIGDDVQHVYDHEALFRISADRIEELIAERNDWESHAIYNAEFVDLAVSYRNERDAARAKLAKLVEALEFVDGDFEVVLKARATLAEIKGESQNGQ